MTGPNTVPTASVVVPTYNRLERLRRVLASFERQRGAAGRFEVVVVSDGCTDGTPEYLASARFEFDLVVVDQPNGGPSRARNRGTEAASGDIVVFVDDDVVAAEDLVGQHLRSHDRFGDGAVVIGPMLTPLGYRPGRYVRWEQAMLYKQYAAMTRGDYEPTFRQFYTGNASLRRELLVSAGGFDEGLRRAEDVDLAYRIHQSGGHFHFNQAAIGYHYAERSGRSWLGIADAYGRHEIRFLRDHPASDRSRALRYELEGRHRAIRSLAGLSARRPLPGAALRVASLGAAAAADRIGVESAVLAMLSLAYSTTYFSALCAEAGSPETLWAHLRREPVPAQGPESSHRSRRAGTPT